MTEQVKVFDFMGKRKLALAFSATLMILSIVSLATRGINFGLDFTGGTQIELGFEQIADVNLVRSTLEEAGYKGVQAQYFGTNTDILIRIQEVSDEYLGQKVLELISAGRDDVELRRNEFVGPQVGEELANQGGIGMLVALALVMVYIAFRFQFKFAIGAVVALIHDVVIVLGFFSITLLEFDLTVLAALLAVIGYSLNDTIVVSDRIRESLRTIRRDDVEYLINLSLTQTLGRTIITSGTTMLVLVALAIFGGEMILDFSIALLVGIGIGTYSSIYVSATILMLMNISKEDLMPQERESIDQDEVPTWLKDVDGDSEDAK